ncbi:hypothetical protein MBRA_22590 [Mycobacterium branderi]|uniref:Uncharacterized protein n=1 Tax=Mycobacterium branderi TaxID=43348 RepID=A0ABN6B6P3_9MYCO|nr:hypothetical protein MBRA_22590 [Mycobacterium branderi]
MAGGGGAETVAAAICKPIGIRSTATSAGPDCSLVAAVTAATGEMGVSCKAGMCAGIRGAAALTAPAKIRGVITAMPNAGVRVARITRWHDARSRRLCGRTAKAVNSRHTKGGLVAGSTQR